MVVHTRKIGNDVVSPIGFGRMALSAFYGAIQNDKDSFKVGLSDVCKLVSSDLNVLKAVIIGTSVMDFSPWPMLTGISMASGLIAAQSSFLRSPLSMEPSMVVSYSLHFTLRTPAPFHGVGVSSLDVFASGQTFLLVRALWDSVTSDILLLVGQSMSSAPGASLASTLRYARSVMYFQ